MKPTQFFSDEYLKHTKQLKPAEILSFLEQFRLMHSGADRSKLISIKIPEQMLATFRKRCNLIGVPYQSQIKKLMLEWLASTP